MSSKFGLTMLLLIVVMLGSCVSRPPVDQQGRPLIRKLGTIDCDLVETTPIVFKGKVYRCEWVRKSYKGNKLGDNYIRLVDRSTARPTLPFGRGYVFASAFVDGDSVYVTATSTEAGWTGQRVEVFASKDLKKWENWTALDLDSFGICNTSICKADGQYVMMFEIHKPKEQAGTAFTARFATSKDMRNWELTGSECVYAKDRYTAPHCLRYLDGHFYDFYLEAHDGYETRVVRSKDLIHWEPSPLNPVLKASSDDTQIANLTRTPEQRQHIAKARNINNSDIDFCQYKGRLIINYSWGDQQGTEFLAEAVYDGTVERFLRGWFPQKSCDLK
jgi:alpha-L-fucosidase